MNNDQRPDKDESPLLGRPPGYRSYVLRLWQERGQELPIVIWRFSLEDPLTGQRYGFHNLEALRNWLESEMAQVSEETSE